MWVILIVFSGTEPHWQVGMGSMMISGNLGGVMVSTLARNARHVDSIPALGTIFPIFITPTTYVCVIICL